MPFNGGKPQPSRERDVTCSQHSSNQGIGYQPEMWTVPKDAIYAAIEALRFPRLILPPGESGRAELERGEARLHLEQDRAASAGRKKPDMQRHADIAVARDRQALAGRIEGDRNAAGVLKRGLNASR